MGLTGPSRTITVEPMETPAPPEPVREDPAPERVPEKTPEKEPVKV